MAASPAPERLTLPAGCCCIWPPAVGADTMICGMAVGMALCGCCMAAAAAAMKSPDSVAAACAGGPDVVVPAGCASCVVCCCAASMCCTDTCSDCACACSMLAWAIALACSAACTCAFSCSSRAWATACKAERGRCLQKQIRQRQRRSGHVLAGLKGGTKMRHRAAMGGMRHGAQQRAMAPAALVHRPPGTSAGAPRKGTAPHLRGDVRVCLGALLQDLHCGHRLLRLLRVGQHCRERWRQESGGKGHDRR